MTAQGGERAAGLRMPDAPAGHEARWALAESHMPRIARQFGRDTQRHGLLVSIPRAVLRLTEAGFTRDEAIDLMTRAVGEAHR